MLFLMTDLMVSVRLLSSMVLSLDLEMGDKDLSFLQTGDRLTLFRMMLLRLFLMVSRLKLALLLGCELFVRV